MIKLHAVQLSLILLIEADQDVPLMEAERLHRLVLTTLHPFAGCGMVDWATSLIQNGKVRNAIHALRVILSRTGIQHVDGVTS